MPDPDTDTATTYTADPRFSWITSEVADKVIPDFVEALWEMEDVVKTSKVEAGPMRYTYADLAAVLAAARPKLETHNLALSQVATVDHGVTTTLFHKSGQWIQFAALKIAPAGGTPQHIGSAITYARRYSALAVLGMATEDDDARAAAVAPSPPVENPLTGRVDESLHRMGALSDAGKAKMRSWADAEGRKLSGKALYADAEWLSQVEAWLDVNEVEDDNGEPDEPDGTPETEPF